MSKEQKNNPVDITNSINGVPKTYVKDLLKTDSVRINDKTCTTEDDVQQAQSEFNTTQASRLNQCIQESQDLNLRMDQLKKITK